MKALKGFTKWSLCMNFVGWKKICYLPIKQDSILKLLIPTEVTQSKQSVSCRMSLLSVFKIEMN